MVKGVIFDMDGLMFDTERLWDTFWAPCCEKLGLSAPPADFCPGCRGLAGENLRNHIHRYYPAIDPQRLLDEVWAYGAAQMAKGVPCKPGLRELLGYLETIGMPRIVASSSPRDMIEMNLQTTARRIGLPADDCLVLEDSFNGVRAGHAAGAVTVMVPDLAEPTQEILGLCHRCCHDLHEVLALLKDGKL